MNKGFTTVVKSVSHETAETLILIDGPVVNTPCKKGDSSQEVSTDHTSDVKELHEVGGSRTGERPRLGMRGVKPILD